MKKRHRGLFDAAFERSLFENAFVIFDDLFQEREVKDKFLEFCTVYQRAMPRRIEERKGNGKRR